MADVEEDAAFVRAALSADIRRLDDENERLRLRLGAILEWHKNWDAPFHDEDEWIEDFRLAREALGESTPLKVD